MRTAICSLLCFQRINLFKIKIPSLRPLVVEPGRRSPMHGSLCSPRKWRMFILLVQSVTLISLLLFRTTEFRLSILAMNRLAATGLCRVMNCNQLFTSAATFKTHLRDIHDISGSKNGCKEVLCSWTGCGKTVTTATLLNHLLGDGGLKYGCGLCDKVITARADSVQRHYREHHQTEYPNVKIPLAKASKYAYLFFLQE